MVKTSIFSDDKRVRRSADVTRMGIFAESANYAASSLEQYDDESKDTVRAFLLMQAFVASLTAALLFIHTVFGCCWHHAHACEHSLKVAVSQPHKCCHHHHHDEDSQQHEKPGKCKSDCEGTCSYVVPQKVTIEAPQWIAIDLLAVLPSPSDRQIEAAASWEALLSPSDLAPPLRTHLLHQVFLN
jgi:hypothetical protein